MVLEPARAMLDSLCKSFENRSFFNPAKGRALQRPRSKLKTLQNKKPSWAPPLCSHKGDSLLHKGISKGSLRRNIKHFAFLARKLISLAKVLRVLQEKLIFALFHKKKPISFYCFSWEWTQERNKKTPPGLTFLRNLRFSVTRSKFKKKKAFPESPHRGL